MRETVILMIKELMKAKFTGELRISFYRGGISKEIKIVTLKSYK